MQGDLYTITWETNFGEKLATRCNEPIPTNLPNNERPITSDENSTDARESEKDYIITNDDMNNTTDAAQRQNERINEDVNKRNESNEAARNEKSDWPNPAVYPKYTEKSLPNLSERQKNDANFSE